MSKVFVTLLFLGISLAAEQSEVSQPPLLRRHLLEWTRKAAETLTAEVREAASRLKQAVSLAESPEVQRLATLYQDNHHFIHHCDFPSELTYELHGLPSCINITGDLANLTVLAIYGYNLADNLAAAVVIVLNELNQCSEESIWSQIKCYKNTFEDIQNDIKEYTVDCNEFLGNATVVLKEIGIDIKSCFSFSEKFSVDWVESKIELCKLDLERQQLL